MRPPPFPRNEKERIEALLRYDILGTDPEQEYDEYANLVAFVCDTPIALVSLVDTDRQWFKAKVGLAAEQTHRDNAFCAHAICEEAVFVVNDALEDERFADNPLVTGAPHVRFYAGAPLITPDGHSLGTLCVIDHVPRHLTEKQIDALRVVARQVVNRLELRRMNLQLREAARHLLDLAATKDELFAVVSHDLMSPFTSILGFSEILMNEMDVLPREEQREMVRNIRTSGEATLRLLENLLRWSMLQTGSVQHHPAPLDIRLMMNHVRELLAGAALKKSLRLHFEVDPSLHALADHAMLHSVLQNLVFNAIKFTPDGGVIRTSAVARGTVVEISVADTGVGMTPDKVRALFAGSLAATTHGTAGERGTGFGLQLCKRFVEENGGELWVESELNRGTTFRLTLPRLQDTAISSRGPSSVAAQSRHGRTLHATAPDSRV